MNEFYVNHILNGVYGLDSYVFCFDFRDNLKNKCRRIFLLDTSQVKLNRFLRLCKWLTQFFSRFGEEILPWICPYINIREHVLPWICPYMNFRRTCVAMSRPLSVLKKLQTFCKLMLARATRRNYISISFHIEWDMIVMTVFLSILNQMNIHLFQNRKENCHHDHIPFNVKGKCHAFTKNCSARTAGSWNESLISSRVDTIPCLFLAWIASFPCQNTLRKLAIHDDINCHWISSSGSNVVYGRLETQLRQTRYWRLSASCGTNWVPPETRRTSLQYLIEGFTESP